MIKVLTAAQMREVDRLTTERYGIPSIILMENAAHAVARVINEKLGGSVKGKRILILCGKGNNGGDGAAVARLLFREGSTIRLILFAKIDQTKGDARTNFDRLPPQIEVCEAEEWWQAWEYVNRLNWDDLECVVDAVFGTGLKSFRDDLNEIIGSFSDIAHVAVDLPTGLMADGSGVEANQYSADTTVTFTSPKRANILPPASELNGELIVADIGTPQELIDEQPSQIYLAERSEAGDWLKRTEFSSDSYKNKRGHSLIVAGSENYSGAAVLAANAAVRSGVGLVTLACPADAKAEIASRLLPEVILTTIGSDDLSTLVERADSVAVGCGMDTDDSGVADVVRQLIANRTKPTIVDAGALALLQKPAREQGRNEGDAGLSDTATAESDEDAECIALAEACASATDERASAVPLILTPHEGEFLRLLANETENHRDGETPPPLPGKEGSLKEDRVAAVRAFATRHGVILVLKGERVLIGSPDGRVVVNPTGNSGLGKAGNGDTLAGILAGFVAQAAKMEIDIFETVVAAVYVAGMAGDIAEKKFGKRVMTASDVRECLAEVFNEFENSKV